ncbi:zinc-binding alcohol dehydrogenase family protein [Paracoccus liaowanqingii]|uniref:Zinc-binding alcohol dehydrogenase family protein n=1 Tax=Paracoccus liaowanqingii TaxID=2560053 RepID=A0A4Z1CRV0_9RHOB|nr:zinc-binding alcohol dehydrogenase family protein [Paracoccus liaowanqingii]TGN67991.1 zinc-binding alcohol dehydrogenase family protein [Paracoccus liaowanqingii]
MTKNTTQMAAWQHADAPTLRIAPAPIATPEGTEILIRNAAIAINPLDWLLQSGTSFPWLDMPTITGSDVAGVVAAIGPDVTRFAIGDRVLGQAVSTTVNKATEGAFQQFTIVAEHMASPIPDTVPFADAAVLPLGLGTAASGLFGETQLALAPQAPEGPAGVVLVWGGASSVGCNAIQLAATSGYEVFATASARNAAMLEDLGAAKVFDYASATLVQDLLATLQGRILVGALHATGNIVDCAEIVAGADGSSTIAATLPAPDGFRDDVTVGHIFGTALKDDAVGPLIYRDFLPDALAQGRYKAAPKPQIVGHGLEALQSALDLQKAGVSGAKIVVTLD